ncbi:MAG: (2Fe-2S)-binding protein, partial [Proteobacteria bacterium]|nr:(2Fe-2S)-binding protein [Pseudomonadota bacterium]
KSYRLAEAMGAVWFWHDAEGGEPEWELDVLPQWNDPAWVRWSLASLGMLDQHPMELLDNIADYPHLDPIHGAHTNRFENEFQEHKVIQRQAGPHRDMLGEPGTPPVDLINITTYHGPGLLISDMRMPNADTVIAITHTPVDDGRVKVWHGLMVKGMSGSTQHTAEDAAEAHALEAQNRLGFAQDFEVWQHKAPCFQGMYVAGDGPFRKVRQWYRQFYNPRRQKDEFTPPAGQRYLAKGVAPFTPVAEFPETV